MSYGRHPYYIYGDYENMHFHGERVSASIPEDAIAQFVASMAWRGQKEIDEWLDRGKKLRPELDDYELIYRKKEKPMTENKHEHRYSWAEVSTTYGTVIKDGIEICQKTVYSENKCSCGDVDGRKWHTEAC